MAADGSEVEWCKGPVKRNDSAISARIGFSHASCTIGDNFSISFLLNVKANATRTALDPTGRASRTELRYDATRVCITLVT